jgi:acyl-CoA thioesterase-1
MTKRLVESVALLLLSAVIATGSMRADAGERMVRIVALGDSLTAGFGISEAAAFPAQLERALRAKGHMVEVANAGVSGDTASDGLARLDWAVATETDAVIVELGANDALRGLDPGATRAALDEIVGRLRAAGKQVLLAGMLAPRNLGHAYTESFDPIYADLAARHDTLLYPFFLEGVALDPSLNQPDGLHPNEKGVTAIVERILPSVEKLIARVRSASSG